MLDTSCHPSVYVQHAGIVSWAVRSASQCYFVLSWSCDHSVDIQHAVIVSKAVICAYSGGASLQTSSMLLL